MTAIVHVVGVRETAADLQELRRTVPSAVSDALNRGGWWVTYEARDLLRSQIGRSGHLPHYPRSIRPGIERSRDAISMIVGPVSGMLQGGMGPGVEFGSVNTGPKPHLFDAFDNRVESILDRISNNIATWPSGGRR